MKQPGKCKEQEEASQHSQIPTRDKRHPMFVAGFGSAQKLLYFQSRESEIHP